MCTTYRTADILVSSRLFVVYVVRDEEILRKIPKTKTNRNKTTPATGRRRTCAHTQNGVRGRRYSFLIFFFFYPIFPYHTYTVSESRALRTGSFVGPWQPDEHRAGQDAGSHSKPRRRGRGHDGSTDPTRTRTIILFYNRYMGSGYVRARACRRWVLRVRGIGRDFSFYGPMGISPYHTVFRAP